MNPTSFITAAMVSILLVLGGLSLSSTAQPVGPDSVAEQSCKVDSIVIYGNKITRTQIILREVMFKVGDLLPESTLDSLMSRTRENIMNTLLFNFVDVARHPSGGGPGRQVVTIHVTERWYVWPVPILKISDRNFNVWWKTKDFSRLSYGFYIDWKNFRGRKENLLMRFQFGYDQIYDFKYIIPYINRKKTVGLGIGAGYWRKKETAYSTMYNKQQFYKNPNEFSRQDIYAFTQINLRPNIYVSHMFELKYDHHDFSDSLLAQNDHYSVNGAHRVQYMTFHYLFKLDHRDYKTYPLKGYYVDADLIKQGLWTFKENTLDNTYLLATYRRFWDLGHRVYFATGINGKVSIGPTQPYFVLKGIGYDRDYVRSYEYYLVDARDFMILKNNIKFALIPQKKMVIDFIRNEKFSKTFYALYLDVFFDAGYGWYNQAFGRETNDLQNSLLLGYGAGLDFVTYYDVVIRLEFSMNFMSEGGIFLHFMAPI